MRRIFDTQNKTVWVEKGLTTWLPIEMAYEITGSPSLIQDRHPLLPRETFEI